MPEEAPAVQNWRLLIVACVLGLVVMIVYNMHIAKVRRGMDTVKVVAYRYPRNIEVGEKVAEKDLERIEIPKDTAERLGGLLERREKDALAVGHPINRTVSKSNFAMTGHFTISHSSGPSVDLPKDNVNVTIPVDSKKTPGRVLRIGNHVNILGVLPTKGGGAYTTFRIIERLRVVAIGGQTERGDKMSSAERGVRSYSTITVEMKRRNPDVSLQWNNLQTHLNGPAIIEICSSSMDPFPAGKSPYGVVNKELEHLTKTAAGGGDGLGGFGSDDGY